MDNIILAYEVIHFLHSTKSPSMLMTLDLSKDFDKLNWNYLKATLLAFGFDPSVITLNCSTHAYLVSGQLISLLFQNSVEQLFENPLVSRPTLPNPLLHACASWLTHYSLHVPNKARKKESCRQNKKLWVS
jgi:hypothetical protein